MTGRVTGRAAVGECLTPRKAIDAIFDGYNVGRHFIVFLFMSLLKLLAYFTSGKAGGRICEPLNSVISTTSPFR